MAHGLLCTCGEHGSAAPLRNLGQMYWADRVREAAIKDCRDHYDAQHVNTIPPCAAALHDAEWWAVALGIASSEKGSGA